MHFTQFAEYFLLITDSSSSIIQLSAKFNQFDLQEKKLEKPKWNFKLDLNSRRIKTIDLSDVIISHSRLWVNISK